MERIGIRLAQARQTHGWSLREAARRAGWTPQHQMALEHGDTAPTVERVAGIARALGVDVTTDLVSAVMFERFWWQSDMTPNIAAQIDYHLHGNDFQLKTTDSEGTRYTQATFATFQYMMLGMDSDNQRHELVNLLVAEVDEVRLRQAGIAVQLHATGTLLQVFPPAFVSDEDEGEMSPGDEDDPL